MLSYGRSAIGKARQSVPDLVQHYNDWTWSQQKQPLTASSLAVDAIELGSTPKYDKQFLLAKTKPRDVAKYAQPKQADPPACPSKDSCDDDDMGSKTLPAPTKNKNERPQSFVETAKRKLEKHEETPLSRSVCNIDKIKALPVKSRSVRNIAYLTSDATSYKRATSSNDIPSDTNDVLSETQDRRTARKAKAPLESTVSSTTDVGIQTISFNEDAHAPRRAPNSECVREQSLLAASNSTIDTCTSQSSRSTLKSTAGISNAEKIRRRTRSLSSNAKNQENLTPHMGRASKSKSIGTGMDREYRRSQLVVEQNKVQGVIMQTRTCAVDDRRSSSGVVSDMSSGELYRQSRVTAYVASVQASRQPMHRNNIGASAPAIFPPRAVTEHNVPRFGGSVGDTHLSVDGCHNVFIDTKHSGDNSTAGINQSQLSIASTDRQQVKTSIKDDTQHILEMYTDTRNVATRRLNAAKTLLTKLGLLVIIGEPGDGTTQMAYDLMVSSGRTPYLVADTSDYLCCIENENNGIVLADDTFGKSDFEKSRYQKWQRLMHRIMSYTKKGTIYMIMIVKSSITPHCKEFLDEYKDYMMKLSDPKHILTVAEMKNIFKESLSGSLKLSICDSDKDENIKTSSGQYRLCIAESTVDEIARIALPSGYPKAVKRFITTKDNLAQGAQYFRLPNEELCTLVESWGTASATQLDKQRYLALQCVFVHGGTFDMKELDQLKENSSKRGHEYKHPIEKLVGCSADQTRNPKARTIQPPTLTNILFSTSIELNRRNTLLYDIKNGIRRLEGVYLKRLGSKYKFAATCVEIAITLSCGHTFPKYVIKSCNNNILCSNIGPDSAFIDENRYIPIRESDKSTCSVLADRLKDEIIQGNVQLVAGHPAMKEPWFVDFFFQHIKSVHKLTWTIICKTDTNTDKTLLSHGLDQAFFERRGDCPKNLAEYIVMHKKWMQKRKGYTEAARIEREVLEHCCTFGTADSYFNLIERLHIPVTTACLLNAVDNGSFSIVNDLVTIRPSPFEYADLCKALQRACLRYCDEAKENRMAIIKNMVQHAPIDYKLNELESVIHIAGRTGNGCLLGIVDTFNGDMDLTNSHGLTCLHLAAINKQAGITAVAIDYGASQKKGDRLNQLPIHKAAEFDSDVVAEVLVNRDPGVVKLVDSKGETALHVAAKFNNATMTKFLIQNGSNINARNYLQQTPMHISAGSDYAEALHFLIVAKANINLTDLSGYSPLHAACSAGNTKGIKRFMKEVNKQDIDKFRCLEILVTNNDEVSLRTCVDNGFNVNSESKDGISVLHHAILIHSPLASTLIEMGADVTKMANSMAPIHLVARRGDMDLLSLLLNKGADAETETYNTKDTALHIAARHGHLDCVRLIVSQYNECLVEARNKRGETPLHVATMQGDVVICRVLLQYGSSPSAITKRGETPAHLAAMGIKRESNNRNHRLSDYRKISDMLTRRWTSMVHVAHLESAV